MKKAKKKDRDLIVGRRDWRMVHFNFRIPSDWVPILTEILEQKQDQHVKYSMSDLMRENIFHTFIKPVVGE